MIIARSALSMRSIVLAGAIALLAGCATPTTYEGMVPTAFDIAKRHARSVSLAVSGGRETDAMDKPQITDAAFTQALAEAIAKSQTFSRVVQGAGGDYLLTVAMTGMEQPSFGFSFTVKMEAGWTLRRASTGAVVWQQAIFSEHTATTSDAFAAVTRLRLATEGAARNNIAQGLTRISRLDL
ncbi:MAG: hypothetical protein OEW90_21775 [Betaproteobacteria bacterium]|nr:hypothetical protein [Betaproteobacteria bacterium]MDH4326776.1 hypothetical protein [Betaproteobacteria bacterium]